MVFPNISLTVLGLFILLSYLSLLPSVASTYPSHVYIVYLGYNKGQEPLLTTQSHIQLLSDVFSKEDEAKEAMLYSYRHSFSGFAAIINSTQATNLSSKIILIFILLYEMSIIYDMKAFSHVQ
ncbi:uncharacterized protein A4U43_C03F32120 [Asparagus officinalis]|uniref:Inhibitor I9 domain-containing protein n=1 Tax=Asparagus officinalis TaxID=4686 RepID=A0A5P1FEJ2_ASPOF|nr:uncharacterized protein A4U43_C03F32120 [Asparagus officinalis]